MMRAWTLGFAAALAAYGLCGAFAAEDYSGEDFVNRIYKYPPLQGPYIAPTDAELSAACANHPDLDLDGYLALETSNRNSARFPRSIQGFVPKDLEIENGAATYVSIRGTAWSYEVPVVKEQYISGAVLRAPDRGISACRVRDRAGKQWVVVRGGVDRLFYYQSEDFEREDLYYRPKDDPYEGYENYERDTTPAKPPLATARCEKSTRPLKQYGAIADDIRKWKNPDFRKVPADMEMQDAAGDYVMEKFITTRVLPGADAYPVSTPDIKTRITSPCRVKDGAGAWWVAYRTARGYLVYMPLAELTAVKDSGSK